MENPSSTSWRLIKRYLEGGPGAKPALDALLRRFERFITALIERRRFPPGQTPEEIRQEFLTRILERDDFAALDHHRGSFRGWLFTALDRHRLNAWRAWHAQRNPGMHARLTDDFETFPAQRGHDPERLCLQQYALDMLDHVVGRLREECRDPTRLEVLLRFLPKRQSDPADVKLAAQSLGMSTATFAKAVHDSRARFLILLRESVADTFDVDPDDPRANEEIEHEIQYLHSVFDPDCVS